MIESHGFDKVTFSNYNYYYENIFRNIYPKILDAVDRKDITAYCDCVEQLLLYTAPFFVKKEHKEFFTQYFEKLQDIKDNIIEIDNKSKTSQSLSMVQATAKLRRKLLTDIGLIFYSIWSACKEYNLLVHINSYDNRPAVVKDEYA